MTKDPAHDWQPAWSPAGTHIVFRSERDGGGLFLVPTTGGHERKICDFGYEPQWSPDGKLVLFSELALRGAGRGEVYTLALDGSPPKPVNLGALSVAERRDPSVGWYDANRVAFFNIDISPGRRALQLVIVDARDGTSKRFTVDPGVNEALYQHRLENARGGQLAWTRDGRTLYFIGDTYGLRNVWKLDVDALTLAVTGGPERLSGASRTARASRCPRTAVVWCSASPIARHGLPSTVSIRQDVKWLQRQSWSPARKFMPAVPSWHAMGRASCSRCCVLEAARAAPNCANVFSENRHPRALCSKTMAQRRGPYYPAEVTERSISGLCIYPASVQGLRCRRPCHVASPVRHREKTPGTIDHADLRSRLREVATGWSIDGKHVIASTNRDKPDMTSIVFISIDGRPTAERTMVRLTESREYMLWNGSMSPNGQWIAFNTTDATRLGGTSQIAVTKSKGGPWTWMTDATTWADKPRWSGDGRLLYYISRRERFFNVWATGFDQSTGTAAGQPFRVTHFDSPGLQMLSDLGELELAVGGGRLAIPVLNPTGGIWMLENFGR